MCGLSAPQSCPSFRLVDLATDSPREIASTTQIGVGMMWGIDVGVRKTGTLRASYRELTATASIDFVCPEAGTEDGWAVEVIDDAADLGVGCACSANGSRIPVGATLAGLLLGLLSRRRRKATQSAAVGGKKPA